MRAGWGCVLFLMASCKPASPPLPAAVTPEPPQPASEPKRETAPPPAATEKTVETVGEPVIEWPSGGSEPQYPNEPVPKEAERGKPILGCTYSLNFLKEHWDGTFTSTGLSNGQPAPCEVAKRGKRHAEYQGAAQKIISKYGNYAPKDLAVIPDDEDWDNPKPVRQGASTRQIKFRHYKFDQVVDYELTKCRVRDRKIVCEASGSKSAKAINMMHWHMALARDALTRRKFEVCGEWASFVFGWNRGLLKFRETQKSEKKWIDGFTYKTRWDGNLSEEALFAKAALFADEAKDLAYQCGRPEPKVTTAGSNWDLSFSW